MIKTGLLIVFCGLLMLMGGVFLELDRIHSTQNVLESTANLAVFQSTNQNDAGVFCRKRLEKTIWTNTEIKLIDLYIVHTHNKHHQRIDLYWTIKINLVVGRYFGLDSIKLKNQTVLVLPKHHTYPKES